MYIWGQWNCYLFWIHLLFRYGDSKCWCFPVAAHIPLYLYHFLNTTSKSKPFEYLRLTSLGVIGALVKVLHIHQFNILIIYIHSKLCLLCSLKRKSFYCTSCLLVCYFDWHLIWDGFSVLSCTICSIDNVNYLQPICCFCIMFSSLIYFPSLLSINYVGWRK